MAERDAQGRSAPRGSVPRTGTGRKGTGGTKPTQVTSRDSKGNILMILVKGVWKRKA